MQEKRQKKRLFLLSKVKSQRSVVVFGQKVCIIRKKAVPLHPILLHMTRINKKDTTMEKKLRKSKDKKLSGVCAGIAEYLGWDPTLVRLGWVLLSICSAAFPGLLAYIICALVMPDAED